MRDSLISTSKAVKDKKATPILLLVSLAIVFMFASILVFSELVQYQKKVMAAAEENALWASYQLDKELIKLRGSLQDLEENYSEVNLEDTRVRFEILYSRVNILSDGKLKVLFSRSSNAVDILSYIRAKLDEMDLVLFSTKNVDVMYLLEESKLLIHKTESFILDALGSRVLEKEKNRHDYQSLLTYLGGLIGLLTITVMFIVYILFRQLKIVERSYEKSRKLTVELENAVISSEQALRVKSDFIATMSHEIRTPMNAIIGFSYLLMSGDVPEKYREKIHSIQKAADGLLAIINRILDFSKIESGKIELENSSFEIDQALEYIYQVNKVEAKNKGLNFLVYRDFSMANFLIGDEIRLQQILINLVSNAIKFTQAGSVTVRVYKSQNSELVIEVNDTGIGIREGIDIFDVFKQADSSTTRIYGGTGLGLSITQKLVQLLGGCISYKSEENKGSQFVAVLPYLPDPQKVFYSVESVALLKEDSVAFELLNGLNMDRFFTVDFENISTCKKTFLTSLIFFNSNSHLFQSKEKLINEAFFFFDGDSDSKDKSLQSGLITPRNLYKNVEEKMLKSIGVRKNRLSSSMSNGHFPYRGKTVLLAEDNRVNANIVMAILNKMKVSVDWVENGEEAYKKSISNYYDLIIMDIRMPVMDGYQASEKIYYALKERKPPVIVLTADVINLNKNDFKNSFFDDVLFKPLDPHAFIKKIKFWFETKTFNKINAIQSDETFNATVSRNSELVAELERLQELLMDGNVRAGFFVKKLMNTFSDYDGIDSMKLAVDDIDNYDYQDALVRVKRFQQIYCHNIEEGVLID